MVKCCLLEINFTLVLGTAFIQQVMQQWKWTLEQTVCCSLVVISRKHDPLNNVSEMQYHIHRLLSQTYLSTSGVTKQLGALGHIDTWGALHHEPCHINVGFNARL